MTDITRNDLLAELLALVAKANRPEPPSRADGWLSTREIAEESAISDTSACRRLRKMLAAGEVEVQTVGGAGGSRVRYWRVKNGKP